jgi:hypothetical protein
MSKPTTTLEATGKLESDYDYAWVLHSARQDLEVIWQRAARLPPPRVTKMVLLPTGPEVGGLFWARSALAAPKVSARRGEPVLDCTGPPLTTYRADGVVRSSVAAWRAYFADPDGQTGQMKKPRPVGAERGRYALKKARPRMLRATPEDTNYRERPLDKPGQRFERPARRLCWPGPFRLRR